MVQGKPTVSPGMQDGFLLPPLIMLRQKDTDSKTAVPSIISTGIDGDIFLPPLDMLRQKNTDPETATLDVLPTHNACACNINEEIDSTTEVDFFSMFYSEFSEETTYYEEEQVDNRPAFRGRRHHKRHGKNGRRHRHAKRSRDQREESPAVIDPLPDIIMDTLFTQ